MNQSKHRVAIDVDGVVANFTDLFLNAIRTATNRDIPKDWKPPKWDIEEALGLTKAERVATSKLISAAGVASYIAPYPGAVEGIKKLTKIADVFFVTSPLKSSPTWCYDRVVWLTKYFGEELADRVDFTWHKYAFAADILVDDKPSNCEE